MTGPFAPDQRSAFAVAGGGTAVGAATGVLPFPRSSLRQSAIDCGRSFSANSSAWSTASSSLAEYRPAPMVRTGTRISRVLPRIPLLRAIASIGGTPAMAR